MGLLVWTLATANATWASVVMTGPNMTSILRRRDRAIAPHPAHVFPSARRVPPSVQLGHPWKSLPLSRVAVRTLERCGYLAVAASRRNFWLGTAGMCLVRQINWYAWAWAGVIAVMKRILPSMQSPKFPAFSVFRRWWLWAERTASMTPITTIPYWRLRRKTWVIKSWKRWPLRGSTVACPMERQRGCTAGDIHSYVKGNQFHPGNQFDTSAPLLPCENFVPYTVHCRARFKTTTVSPGRESIVPSFMSGKISAMRKRLTGQRIMETRRERILTNSCFWNHRQAKQWQSFAFCPAGIRHICRCGPNDVRTRKPL